MAKKQDKKMKQQNSGTTARTAGTTARAQKAAREKLKNQAMFQAAVQPLPPAVLPPPPETVVPLEVPLLLPAHLKTLLYPTVSARYRPRTTASIEDNYICKCSGTTVRGQRYYRFLQERYYRYLPAVLPL